ncbi:MAG TPA: hypothetical protein VFQ81_12310 [Candidatus Limnocylindria bacterium]|nr:hypothetical protein [Candidatus Limnocylindria bacterium]
MMRLMGPRLGRAAGVIGMALLVSGCMPTRSSETQRFPTVEAAADAAGFDPGELLYFDADAAIVHHPAPGEIGVHAWHRDEEGWIAAGNTVMARIGPMADALLMGGAISTRWQVSFMYGFLPPGVAAVQSDIPGAILRVAPSGAYMLVLGDVNDPRTDDLQAVAWRMLDANGDVVRAGAGDCCPQVDPAGG